LAIPKTRIGVFNFFLFLGVLTFLPPGQKVSTGVSGIRVNRPRAKLELGLAATREDWLKITPFKASQNSVIDFGFPLEFF